MVSPQRLLPTLPCLMVVTSPSLPFSTLCSAIQAASFGGAGLIQLRDKSASAVSLYDQALLLRRHIPPHAKLLLNDRVDIALAVNADGVHLPESGLSVSAARRLLGPGKLVGRSVHSIASAVQAEAEGADYLLVGTMFPSKSKPGKIPEGPALLKQIREVVEIPLLGIGGVQPDNVVELIEAGGSGCGVISYVLEADAPEDCARLLCEAMETSMCAR